MTAQGVRPRDLDGAASEEASRVDLELCCQSALKSGASDAVVIPAGDVSADERVRLSCVVPRCIRAGETPN